jgi:HEPN domain-containing protein
MEDMDAVNSYDEGLHMLKIANKSMGRDKVFTPTILYHMSIMAMEKLIRGFFFNHEIECKAHGFGELIKLLSQYVEIDEVVITKAAQMERTFKICALIPNKSPITEDHAKEIISIANQIEAFLSPISKPCPV